MTPERARLKMIEIFAVAFLFAVILFPASTGITFGIRKKYVKVLGWIMFEVRWGSSLGISSKNRASHQYGRGRIQEHENPLEEDIIAGKENLSRRLF